MLTSLKNTHGGGCRVKRVKGSGGRASGGRRRKGGEWGLKRGRERR